MGVTDRQTDNNKLTSANSQHCCLINCTHLI